MKTILSLLLCLMVAGCTGAGAQPVEAPITEEGLASADPGTKAGIFADFFLIWLNKGWDLADDGKYTRALEAFDHAFRYSPSDPVHSARAWAGRARVYLAREQYPEALEAADEVLESGSGDQGQMARAWVSRGIALRHLGQYSESYDAFGQALALEPGDVRTRQHQVITRRLMQAAG